MNWEDHRRSDSSINLINAYREVCDDERRVRTDRSELYLEEIMELNPISSRQAAAIAVGFAMHGIDAIAAWQLQK